MFRHWEREQSLKIESNIFDSLIYFSCFFKTWEKKKKNQIT